MLITSSCLPKSEIQISIQKATDSTPPVALLSGVETFYNGSESLNISATLYWDVLIQVIQTITHPQTQMMDRAPNDVSKAIEQSAKGKLYSLRDSSTA